MMQCPECKSEHIRKNGKNRQGKQNYVCAKCDRQFITDYEAYLGYSEDFKRECLKMYVNGMGFRAIERVKGVHHTTIITWVKEVGELLPDSYEPEIIPQVGELDELETFIGSKKTRSGKGDSSRPLSTWYFRMGFRRSRARSEKRRAVPRLLNHCGKLSKNGSVISTSPMDGKSILVSYQMALKLCAKLI